MFAFTTISGYDEDEANPYVHLRTCLRQVLKILTRLGLYKAMNIQIFGKLKCFDTKKAERYFKERRIKYQLIDIAKYGISKGEYQSVKNAVGGFDPLVDTKSKEYERQYMGYLGDQNDKEERLLENPGMFKTPIVRNGKKATVGYEPEIWGRWE